MLPATLWFPHSMERTDRRLRTLDIQLLRADVRNYGVLAFDDQIVIEATRPIGEDDPSVAEPRTLRQ